jgi:hypothetical protein
LKRFLHGLEALTHRRSDLFSGQSFHIGHVL